MIAWFGRNQDIKTAFAVERFSTEKSIYSNIAASGFAVFKILGFDILDNPGPDARRLGRFANCQSSDF